MDESKLLIEVRMWQKLSGRRKREGNREGMTGWRERWKVEKFGELKISQSQINFDGAEVCGSIATVT